MISVSIKLTDLSLELFVMVPHTLLQTAEEAGLQAYGASHRFSRESPGSASGFSRDVAYTEDHSDAPGKPAGFSPSLLRPQ